MNMDKKNNCFKEPITKDSKCSYCKEHIVHKYYIRSVGENDIYCSTHCYKFTTKKYIYKNGENSFDFVCPETECVIFNDKYQMVDIL